MAVHHRQADRADYPPKASVSPTEPVFESLESRILLSSYYIATTGSDSNAGTEEAPYATLAKFFEEAEAGDTCYIRGGTYEGTRDSGWWRLDPTVSGTADNWITIRGYQGEEVTIDGGGTDYSFMYLRRGNAYLRFQDLNITRFNKAFNIYSSGGNEAGHHIDLEDLDLSYAGDYGVAGQEGKPIRLAYGAHDINIRRSNLHHNAGPGVAMIGDVWNILIEDTDSHDNDDSRGTSGDADGFNATYTTAGYASNVVFRRCRVWNVAEDGIDVKGDLITYDGCKVWNTGANAFKAWSMVRIPTQGRFTVRDCLGFDAGEVIFEAMEQPDLDIADSIFVSTDDSTYQEEPGGENTFLYKPASDSATWQGKLKVRNSTFLRFVASGYSNVEVEKQNVEILDLDYNTYYDVNRPELALIMRDGGASTYYSNTDMEDGTFFAAEGLEEHGSGQLVNVSPFVLSMTGSQGVDAGEEAAFSAVAFDPDNGDLTYTWSFGDGSDPVVGSNVTHVYAQGGVYSVTVTVEDDNGGQENLTQEFMVYNGTTTAVSDSYSVNEDEVLTVAASGVLSNDSDADGDTLTASPVDNPDHGTLVLNADGSFRYTPDAGYNGTDSFSYTAGDGNGGADTATVSINVISVNDVPLAGHDIVLSGVNSSTTIDVLHNDTDVQDGDTLSVSDFTSPAHGTVVNNGDGTLTYTPDADFVGEDSFTYTVSDGNGGYADAAVTLTIVASPAFRESGGIVVMETEHFTLDAQGSRQCVWTETTDFAGASGETAMEATPNTGVHQSTSTNGPRLDYMIDFSTTGMYRVWVRMLGRTGHDDSVHVGLDRIKKTGYSGIANMEGYWDWERSPYLIDVSSPGIHTFNVWMREDGVLVDKIVLTTDLNFTPSGQGPGENMPTVAVPIADVTVNEDADDMVVDLSAVFDDVEDGTSLTFSVADNTNSDLVTTSLTGTNLTLSYAAQQTGTANITIRATDSDGGWVLDTFSVTTLPVNDPPTATDDLFRVGENSVGNVLDVLVNDTTTQDADETLSIVDVSAGSSRGTINIVPGGTAITYSPLDGFSGSETFTYTINDGTPGSDDTATVTVSVMDIACINFSAYSIDSYGGSQDVNGTVTVEGNGLRLHMVGNLWKKIDFAYTVTPQTILEFNFKSDSEGEIHGIGFDTDPRYSEDDRFDCFELYGTQTWGHQAFNDYDMPGAHRHYLIPIGQYYTGQRPYLFFINDHDVTNPTGESLFWNVRVYEPASVNHAPTVATPITDVTVDESADDTLVDLSGVFNDAEDGAALTLSVAGNTNSSLVTTGLVGTDLTLSYTPTASGTANITIRATDSDGAWVEDVFTVIVNPVSQVFDQYIFYNNSLRDGYDSSPNASDDTAIATNKSALHSGQTATFANYTSYSRGINGIIVDIDDFPGTPDLADFAFRTGIGPDPSDWSDAPSPTMTVRHGAGVGGSDRVTIIWADYVIRDEWLEVTVKAGGNIGLREDYVFYFGNIVADTDGDGQIGSYDYDRVVGEFGGCGNDLTTDFNQDAQTDIEDLAILRAVYGNSVPLLTLPDLIPPAAPQASASPPSTSMATAVSSSAVSVVTEPLQGDVSDAPSAISAVLWPVVDLLVESVGEYTSSSQSAQVGPVTATLRHTATTEEDLRTVDDDLLSGSTIDDPLPDVLTEQIRLPWYHIYPARPRIGSE